MTITLNELIRRVSHRCGDVIAGIATGGTSTTLVDSRLASQFSDDDVFNGGTVVLNDGSGAMLFTSDCESVPIGDFTAVTVTDNDCKLTRDRAHVKTGKWAYKAVTGADASDVAHAYKTLDTTYTTIYAQAHFYAEDAFTGATDILSLNLNAGTAVVAVRLTNGALSIYNTTAAETYTPTSTTFSSDAWHRIELGLVVSATVGQVMLWLDEDLIYHGRGLNTGSTGIQRVVVGHTVTTTAQAKTIWFDDVKADQAYIGTGVAQTEKTISDYTGSTGTVAWTGNIVAPTANSTKYGLYDWPKTRWSRLEKRDAINQAVRMLWPHFYKRTVDPVTDFGSSAWATTTRNTYRYLLPTNCEQVLNVWLEPTSTSLPYQRLSTWSIDGASGARYLTLPNANAVLTSYDIRIEYMARPIALDDENDELLVDEAYLGRAIEYVTSKALSILWESTPAPDDSSVPMSERYAKRAEQIRREESMPVPQRQIPMEAVIEPVPFGSRIAPFNT